LMYRQGIEEGRELLVKYQVAQESIAKAEGLLEIMNELEIDSGVPTAELERSQRLIPEEDYGQAKLVADNDINDMTRILDEHVTDRVEALQASFVRAEEIGIQVDDIQRSFEEEHSQQDLMEYIAVTTVIGTHEDRVKERTAAYDDAFNRIEEAQTLFTDAEGLQVDVSNASPSLEEARTALSAGRYPDAASKADEAREKVLDLQKQFVLKYIADAEALISELNNMGVDTIQANEYLEQARAGLDLEEYPSAHSSAVQAITESQRVKDLYKKASALIEEARKTIDRANDLGVDTAPALEPLEQAVDSLEFQSYDESIELANKSRQIAGSLMKEYVETALSNLQYKADEAVADGIEFEKGLALVALASTNLEKSNYIEVQDTVDVALAHLDQRRSLSDRTEAIYRLVFEELENAETLGVDMDIYESDTQRFNQFYDEKDYVQAIPWGESLLERLGNDDRAMMEVYIGEVTDLFDRFLETARIPKQPKENLDTSMDYFLESDYIRSYNFAIRARESIETESRSLGEGVAILGDTRNIVAWADGMGVPVDEAKSEMERGLHLMDSNE
ncbi:MAG: hypothetical protein KAX80_15360, partial [Planctomycetes bacterium]|nr:hypothetical protein [Planctomycetota bacterium]